jgi:multisubunit Na+/H+ antiporter MnhC subunit
MTKKSVVIIIGLLITVLGTGMFCFGISMFTYQGPPITPFVSEAGEYCFFFCLPALIVGLAMTVFGFTMKKKFTATRL